MEALCRFPGSTIVDIARETKMPVLEVKGGIHGLRKFGSVESERTRGYAIYTITPLGRVRLERSQAFHSKREPAYEDDAPEPKPTRTWEVADVVRRQPNSVFQMGEKL